ncbi:MAG: 4Fe-4S binding protein [Candidatus Hydrothermarchaeaceae archaeon]
MSIASEDRYLKFDVLRLGPLKRMLRARPFQFLVQLPFVFLLLLVIAAGLYGTQLPGWNLATVGVWAVWWSGIIFLVLFFGKIWCTSCPWIAIGDWIQRKSLWRKSDEPLNSNIRLPKKLRNLYPATALFAVLTWLELGLFITYRPQFTAYAIMFFVFLAVMSSLVYEGRSFCRHLCFIGAIQGVYSMISPMELRSRDRDVCRRCKTKDCLRGNERGYGCPVRVYPGTMRENNYCVLCTECIKTCPYDNVSVNIRPIAQDLMGARRGRLDEAFLIITLLGLTSFHGITMLPAWLNWATRALATESAVYYGVFSVLELCFIFIPMGVIYVTSGLSRVLAGNHDVSTKSLFINYAYAFRPIAMFYQLAHGTMHLGAEGQRLIPVLSDPLGFGWDLFGTAGAGVEPLLTMAQIGYVQYLLIFVGQMMGIYIVFKISMRIFGNKKQALRSLIPVAFLMLIFTLLNAWTLIGQPMVMRTATAL